MHVPYSIPDPWTIPVRARFASCATADRWRNSYWNRTDRAPDWANNRAMWNPTKRSTATEDPVVAMWLSLAATSIGAGHFLLQNNENTVLFGKRTVCVSVCCGRGLDYLPLGCASLTACRISTSRFWEMVAAGLCVRLISLKSSLESRDDPSPRRRLLTSFTLDNVIMYK